MFYESGVEISNLSDYINEIVRLRQNIQNNGKNYFQWYRGHANKSWELVPKVQREFVGQDEALFRKERYLTNGDSQEFCVKVNKILPIRQELR